MEKGQIGSADAQIGVVRKPIAIAQVLGGDAEDNEAPDETEPAIQSNGDSLNDANKVSEHKTMKDIVSQEMKASGKVGRMTCMHSSFVSRPC
jgi:hypothetical protein